MVMVIWDALLFLLGGIGIQKATNKPISQLILIPKETRFFIKCIYLNAVVAWPDIAVDCMIDAKTKLCHEEKNLVYYNYGYF